MFKNWWKILAVIILFYVLLMGFLVPLKPGILSVSPDSVFAGDTVTLSIRGYNTHFNRSTDEIRAWLKLNNRHAVLAENIEAAGEGQMLLATFHVPSFLPERKQVHETALIIDSPVDGSFVMPAAVFIRPDPSSTVTDNTAWTRDEITGLHQLESFRYPYRNILYETIRNTYFHIPMWFGMILLFLGSAYKSMRYLQKRREGDDIYAASLATAGLIFGILGIITGGIWAMYTWGEFWSFDVKQNVAAISLLIYMAYFVLRASFEDPDRKATLSAAYNIFAFVMLIPLLFVIPRMTDSLHPGSGGNPAMGGEDLDNTMRLVFYPAVIGWTLLGLWIAQLRFRYVRLRNACEE